MRDDNEPRTTTSRAHPNDPLRDGVGNSTGTPDKPPMDHTEREDWVGPMKDAARFHTVQRDVWAGYVKELEELLAHARAQLDAHGDAEQSITEVIGRHDQPYAEVPVRPVGVSR